MMPMYVIMNATNTIANRIEPVKRMNKKTSNDATNNTSNA